MKALACPCHAWGGPALAALDDVYLMQVAQELARDPASWGVTLEMLRRPDSLALLLASGQFIDFAQAVAEKQPLAREPLGFLVGTLYYEVIRASEPLVRYPRALLGRMEEHYRQGIPRPAGPDGVPLPAPGQTPKFGMRILEEPLHDPKYWPIFVEVCGHVIEDCEAHLSAPWRGRTSWPPSPGGPDTSRCEGACRNRSGTRILCC